MFSRYEMDSAAPENVPTIGVSEQGNETSDYVNAGNFISIK
jgi:hypothetical protein